MPPSAVHAAGRALHQHRQHLTPAQVMVCLHPCLGPAEFPTHTTLGHLIFCCCCCCCCCCCWRCNLQVVAPGNAPVGCSFCRPRFASASAAPEASTGSGVSAPLLQLEGLWHPLLGLHSSSSVVPNDVVLGGSQPGAMLLTGTKAEVFKGIQTASGTAQYRLCLPRALTCRPLGQTLSQSRRLQCGEAT
jgi:hypothetical protein